MCGQLLTLPFFSFSLFCLSCCRCFLVEEEEEEEIRQKQQHIDDPTIGAPYIVFITSSAIRAVEIGRAFKKITMNTRVVKLFAKHIKVGSSCERGCMTRGWMRRGRRCVQFDCAFCPRHIV